MVNFLSKFSFMILFYPLLASLMLIFAAMQMAKFFRKIHTRRIIGLLLIAVLTVKSCDLLIDHYFAFNKAFSLENSTDDNHHCIGEDNLEKSTKKLYSYFYSPDLFQSPARTMAVSIHWDIYSLSIFTEPLRVVLTPPPNFA